MPTEPYWTRNGDPYYLAPALRPSPDDFFNQLMAAADKRQAAQAPATPYLGGPMSTRDYKGERQPLSLMANVPCIALGVITVGLALLGVGMPLLGHPDGIALLACAVFTFVIAWACFVPAETTD